MFSSRSLTGIFLTTCMASTTQHLVVWGGNVLGYDGHKTSKLLQKSDFEVGLVLPRPLHIAQGLVVTG